MIGEESRKEVMELIALSTVTVADILEMRMGYHAAKSRGSRCVLDFLY
jgi:hypothetical protein